jgi:hypothetical protein
MEASMTDLKQMNGGGNRFDDREPARDHALGALLRQIVGTPPVGDVEWPALAERIARATAGRRGASWWSYAARWERRAIPIAMAAGIAGVVTLWGLGTPAPVALRATTATGATELVTAVVTGAPADDAARSFARSVTGVADLSTEVPD